MSSTGPGDEFPFFDLGKVLGGAGGGDPWASAAELAAAIASEGGREPNLDPVARMRLEDLSRVAELHVAQATGITLPSNTVVTPVTRSEWTRRSVATFRPLFERFGEALGASMTEQPAPPGDPFGAMLGQLFQSLGPLLVSASAGSMLGHLGHRALGSYELPIPRSSGEVLIVAPNVDEAAVEWDVPADELRLWVLVHELTAHAVLSVPHVGRRLDSLLIDYASAFRPNPDLIAEMFGSFTDLSDLSKLQEMGESLNDPELLLTVMRSPAHDLLVPQFDALVAAVLGFVDYTVDEICRGLVGAEQRIRERFRQRTVDVGPADRFMERLLGLDITATTFRRGDGFIDGVVARAGDEGLARVWADELDLPTSAEVDAPGLWLARIGLDGDVGGDDLGRDVPDDLSGLDDL
ncbi:MAG: zinc-dependent metalloprotease [Acidimicrobiales bacterium]